MVYRRKKTRRVERSLPRNDGHKRRFPCGNRHPTLFNSEYGD